MAETNEIPVTSTNQGSMLDNKNTKAALTYLFGWITGLIFLLTEKEDDFIRFHAAQSLLVFGILNLILIIPLINFISILVFPVSVILWVVLMVKAYQGERFALPVIGDYIEQVKDKVK